MKAIINTLEQICDKAEQFRNAYFFSSPSSASGRRSYEKYHSIPEIRFEYDGHIYTAEFSVTCTCSSVYAKGYYTKDGKKTTLTTIKNLIKRMKEAA